MTRTCLLLALLLAAAASAPVFAQPSLAFVDNMNNSVTLQIVLDDTGSTASEITAVDGGLLGTGDITFTGAFIADPSAFDTPNPGFNPITGTVTDGLYLDALATNEVFASFGSAILSPGAYDFLTITYEGIGTIDAFGIVAQLGVSHDVIASIDVVPEPSAALLAGLALVGAFSRRRVR